MMSPVQRGPTIKPVLVFKTMLMCTFSGSFTILVFKTMLMCTFLGGEIQPHAHSRGRKP